MAAVRVLSVVLVVMLAAASGGCGGGGTKEVSAELIQKADAICKRQRTQIQKLRQPTAPALPLIARFLAKVVPIVAKANADLHALEPPKGHEDQWRQLLAESDTSLTQIKRMLAAARGGARIVYGGASDKLNAADQRFLQAANDLGLTVCATPS